jgi:hypothetical protein
VATALVLGAIPAFSGHHALTIPCLLAIFLFHGLCLSNYAINSASLRQSMTPDRFLGRVEAVYQSLTLAASAVGAALTGCLAQLVGVRETLVLLAIVGFVIAGLGLRSIVLMNIVTLPEARA